ncbi:Protein TED1 [Tolypocladium capitatum]|uniref:Protein TED1 n=1 Tax=Tolypocladium capitatum TaxID=45235 RepID=A0A2K3Q9P1_9HYPO|nr:Protein TED1 [Tolypocladium capitatum]
MLVAAFLRHGLRLLVPLAVASTVYLYLYPFFGRCAFPLESRDPGEAFEATKKLHWPYADAGAEQRAPTKLAPFRLLALGDPQLEGDTSIPIAYLGFLPHLKSIARHLSFQTEHESLRERIRMTLHDTVDLYFEDVPNIVESMRKRFDLWGNDFYLAHIYRTLHWWTRPTHVSVLGDLLGSQWIEDDEFDKRGRRFWNRTFKGGERVPDDVATYPNQEYDLSGMLDGSLEEQVWARRILNVAGNHDIGYAGDLTPERMERFERVFGKANYELRFELPIADPEVNATIVDDETNSLSTRLPPEIRVVVLNDMNLDTPAKDPGLQDATYHFINAVIGTAAAVEYQGQFTLILTHIPLYKPEGVCVDAPFFDFHGSEDGGGVKEQFLLSSDASRGILEGIFGVNADPTAPGQGLGRSGLVLNGHDHEGCDTFHYVNQTNGTEAKDRSWEVARWADARAKDLPRRDMVPGRREITVRSMMGDFGGNAGLLSLWFNQTTWEWEYEYMDCPLGRQHFWWLTHFVSLGTVLCAVLYVVVLGLEAGGVDVDGRLHQGVGWVRGGLAQVGCKSIDAAPIGKPKEA